MSFAAGVRIGKYEIGQKLGQGGCDRQQVALSPAQAQPPQAPAATAHCDPVALKDKGLDTLNTGQHAAALAEFEMSLRCKMDPYVVQLAFMESCQSGNSTKAKLYYRQLTTAQRERLSQICVRTHVAYE